MAIPNAMPRTGVRFPTHTPPATSPICDEDGYFTVVGRADDVLNVAGHRIGTADVEGALVSHPAVGEAAVIGIPDEIKGENIKAFVTLRVGHVASPELEAKAERPRAPHAGIHRCPGGNCVSGETAQNA